MVTPTFSSLALLSEAATMVLIAAKFKYFLLGSSAAQAVMTGTRSNATYLCMRGLVGLLRNRMITRLPLEYYQELLHFSPLALDGRSLLLFDLVMKLKFLSGFFRGSDPVVSYAQAVMGLTQLRLGLDRPGVIGNRLLSLVLGERENPKLQVSVGAFGIDGYRSG